MASTIENIFSLAGKTALITGGASGMGRASALLFAEQGAHVVIVDRNARAAAQVVEEITRAGGAAESYAVDLLDQAALDTFVDSYLARNGVLDILFNHAGLPAPAGFDYDQQSFNACMSINVWVPMILTKRLLPLLRKSASASIICTSSIAGLKAVSIFPTYSASKAALIQYIKSVSHLLAPERIRINAICPGATDTPALRRDMEEGIVMATLDQIIATVPLKRMGTPEDMAQVALFLASEASSFMTGVAVPVDGGAIA